QVDRFDSFDEFAIPLRSLLHGLPLRVSTKILPALCRCFFAGECEQVDEFSLCLLRIGWIPKPDDRHVMFLEGFAGVVAEASVQGFHLARCGMVGSQLENTSAHFFVSFGGVKAKAAKAKTQCYECSNDRLHSASSSAGVVV